jgi:hypothetical protein
MARSVLRAATFRLVICGQKFAGFCQRDWAQTGARFNSIRAMSAIGGKADVALAPQNARF